MVGANQTSIKYLGAFAQFLLSGFDVLRFAAPGPQHRGLRMQNHSREAIGLAHGSTDKQSR